jgi:signal transduction histidine kinase/CheY-like chemotaxis protein
VNVDYDAAVRTVARTLSEIAHALESADAAERRVQRTLVLVHEIVPYARCALLKSIAGSEPTLWTVPESTSVDRSAVLVRLTAILHLVEDHDGPGGPTERVRDQLSLPIIGLDRVLGILHVEPSPDVVYDAKHLRLLSVVAAQLGGYFTMLRLRDEDARLAGEVAAAHDFQRLLVGIVSHDLRNPLAVITTVAASLLPKAEDQRQIKALERALRNAQRASRIINDLLDVTHARVTGSLPVSPQRVELKGLLEEAVSDAQAANPGRDIRLIATDDAIEGSWDPDRLSQLATNLLGNALQHGDPGTPVAMSLSRVDGAARIDVHNRGRAIPRDLLPVIFDPFRQGARAAPRSAGGGLGLGLYIVEQIVRAHGGTVEVRSDAEQGTTFTASMPITESGAPRRSAATHARSADAPPGSRPLVLVVDDDPDIRIGIGEILERTGYRITTASNGAEALEMLRAGLRPKLVLLDLSMPVMDGEAFCAACRADPALDGLPVLIISADTASAVKAARFGAAGFLAKPIEVENLVKTVHDMS